MHVRPCNGMLGTGSGMVHHCRLAPFPLTIRMHLRDSERTAPDSHIFRGKDTDFHTVFPDNPKCSAIIRDSSTFRARDDQDCGDTDVCDTLEPYLT